jgi:hypothetical protein
MESGIEAEWKWLRAEWEAEWKRSSSRGWLEASEEPEWAVGASFLMQDNRLR